MYIDNCKLFVKNEKESETLIQGAMIYSGDIGVEFAIEKYALPKMKGGKRHRTVGLELPNQDKIRTHGEKESYKFFGILEADIIKHAEMKDKRKKYLRRTRKLLEIKLRSRNFFKRKNTWAVSLIRYSGPENKKTHNDA